MMKVMTKITLALLPAVFLFVGCGTTGDMEETAQTQSTTAQTQEPAETSAASAQMASAQPMEPEPQQLDPFEDPNSLLSKRVVYFEFDSSAINDEALPIIQAHADYLAGNSHVNFTLEGHADERGTREYNLALGERRADAVRRLLIANGVSPAQVRVVSYGEERPAMLGHDESAWGLNRRAEFIYANR